MTPDNDRLCPSWDESGNVLDHDGLAEDCSVELVTDGAVGTLPHFFKLEFLDTGLVSCDGGALNADLACLDGMSSIEGDLIIGGVTVLDAQVEILDVDVEVGEDQLLLDKLPDDAGHLIAVHVDDGVRNLDFLAFHSLFSFVLLSLLKRYYLIQPVYVTFYSFDDPCPHIEIY